MATVAGPLDGSLREPEYIDVLDLVWSRVHARLERDLGPVELLVSALFDRSLVGTEILEAVDRCDRLAVKLGTLGFPEAADLIRRVAHLFDGDEVGLPQAVSMSSLIDDARTAIAASVAHLRLLPHDGAKVAIVGEISEALDELLWLAAGQGLRVQHHVAGLSTANPDLAAVAVVVDDPILDSARPMLTAIREALPAVPVLVMAPVSEPYEMVGIADVVTSVLDSGLSASEVLAELRQTIIRSQQRLSVGVVGAGGDWLASQLADRGLDAEMVPTVGRLLERVRSGEVRAVVITPDLGGLDPVALLHVIRADRQLRSAVVVMIDENTDATRFRAMLRNGADELVGPTVDLDHLAVLIKARLGRRTTLEPVTEADAHMGTVPWETAVVLIERMLALAFRRTTPVGLAIVRFGVTDDEAASRELDELIADEFRREDVIGRLDDEHLVIALQGVDRNVLLRRMAQLIDKYNLQELGGRAAGVEFPIDGRSLPELMGHAKETLQRSDDRGGESVAGYEWETPGIDPAADVLIVDPDRTLGAVLSATLERRGLVVEHERDAIEAVAYLTGRRGRPLPKVVLLELDLLGLDGLQFLRQVRESGALTRIRVIILSARTNESDLRQAFELGADDYVAKPFSTPLLLHRLNRALEV